MNDRIMTNIYVSLCEWRHHAPIN